MERSEVKWRAVKCRDGSEVLAVMKRNGAKRSEVELLQVERSGGDGWFLNLRRKPALV